jgi:hypothetical protein
MEKDDLSRDVVIDVMASGHCTLHVRGARAPRGSRAPGSLPVFSTDTFDEAKALLVRFCKLSPHGEGYIAPGFDGNLNELEAFGDKLRAEYKRMKGIK